MTAAQFFPIPSELFALACETVSTRVSRLPFLRSGVMVNGELIGVAMESINAEFKKMLPVTTPRSTLERPDDGLDHFIEERLCLPGRTTAPVIAEVLCSAGIAETVEMPDRRHPTPRKGIRLLTPWTWHATSPVPRVNAENSASDGAGSPFSWMSLCPVCRTGILNRVSGKQLFGIPHTDYYVECTHCGAKFIPVGTQFRLVSIASIKDPLWKKNLDKTYPPDTWAALARGTSPGGNPLKRMQEKNVSAGVATPVSGNLAELRDGSLVVPFEGKTLYFRRITVTFSGGMKENLFSRSRVILQDLLAKPAYEHLRSPVNARYSRYLPMATGLFLTQLKERHDPFYREFLNTYGDEKYGTFRLDESADSGRPGVLVVVVRKGLYHAVDCPAEIRSTVNDVFGRLLPEDCLLDRDSVRCRINAVISNNRSDAGFYVYPSGNAAEREAVILGLKTAD